MIINLKDVVKLVGISIVCFCAAFVCTFMLNYYMDVVPLSSSITDDAVGALYKAQVATAQFTSAISGGVLGIIAVIMLLFYIKLYISANSQKLGILKAFGYSRIKISMPFCLFGFSVLIGCALGFAFGWIFMPNIYESLTIEGIDAISIKFHWELLFGLVFAPGIIFSLISVLYAYFALKSPVLKLIKGKSEKVSVGEDKKNTDRPFLLDMCFKTLKSRKLLVFFVTFSCFCFSAMVQMGLSMEELVSSIMGYMILIIGLVLAIITIFMSATSLVNANSKNIAVMKVFGYSLTQCTASIFGGYIPFALLGFAVGTGYQYGLLQIMVNIIFSDVENVPEYTFSISAFFISLASFILCYFVITAYYVYKINRISVKEIMLEN